VYDLWGVAPPDRPDHSWQQISAFKRKFGGDEIALVPTLDLVLDRAAYDRFREVDGEDVPESPALEAPEIADAAA
jgi:hypothetical protein